MVKKNKTLILIDTYIIELLLSFKIPTISLGVRNYKTLSIISDTVKP